VWGDINEVNLTRVQSKISEERTVTASEVDDRRRPGDIDLREETADRPETISSVVALYSR